MVFIPTWSELSFYMDKYEVTNAQYRKFVEATGHREPEDWDNDDFNQPNQPVVGVSWRDALAYAKWAGKRLPTEKEWVWAARGGLRGKKYPWGDQEPNSSRANYGGSKIGKPTAVGSYPANGYGLHDMAGNVYEWCQNSSDINNYNNKALRGGDWYRFYDYLRLAARISDAPNSRSRFYGFRCVLGSN